MIPVNDSRFGKELLGRAMIYFVFFLLKNGKYGNMFKPSFILVSTQTKNVKFIQFTTVPTRE
jgi:hypothetical protein